MRIGKPMGFGGTRMNVHKSARLNIHTLNLPLNNLMGLPS